MKTVVTAIAAILLSTAPALAQDAHHREPSANTSMDMSKMTPAEMRKHCSMMMDGAMPSAPKHNPSSDKLGDAPSHSQPSAAETQAMHRKCKAMMAVENKKDLTPPKP